MAKEKKGRNLIALTGGAALAIIAINLVVSAINAQKVRRTKRKKGLPGSNVCISLTASEIHKLTGNIIAKSKEIYDSVASVPLEKVTYSNVIAPIAELEAWQFPLVQSCLYPKMVSIYDDVRRASDYAEKKLDHHFLICSSQVFLSNSEASNVSYVIRQREDVYRVIKAFVERGEQLGPEAKQYVQCLVKDFERNGVNLSLSKKRELERLKSRIDELTSQYIQSLNGHNGCLLFCESELDGMPQEFIKSLEETEGGKLKMALKCYNVSAILEHCKIGATRKLVAISYGKRSGKENLVVLENLVQLRHKVARLLGYPNYADFAVEPRMTKSSAKVFEFLEEVSDNLTDLAVRELNILKDLKLKEEEDSSFGMEDLAYYMTRVEEKQFDIDLGEIKQYFPVDLVLSGIFRISQDLFGLKFEEIKGAEVWHGTVRLFSVLDFSSSELLGYFYLDLLFREGKYPHTCVFALQNGSLSSNGTHQVPIALLISQCSKQIDGGQGLLRFTEVVTLIHEFSHVVHHICNHASFSRFSGLRLEADFCEIPGRLLENWCYESISLKMMSGYHQDITKCLTSEICKSLKRRREMFSGLKLKQEILVCLLDQIIHSNEDVDMVELLKYLHPKVMLGIPLLDGTNPASCFPQLAIGCEASCYSHLYSEAIAVDIFASKFQDNLLNQLAGLEFRNKVLAPGGAKEPLEILREYLGREPSIQPFIERKVRNSL